ncbi:MAG: biotin/lipoyl-containing protein, partial [Acidobacteriota bacterium]|nr:biotin/lipoyl-containing protein [Acidobacteriota bacterium]
MSTPVVMPQMGESIAEGTIVRWIKKVGDSVDRDEPLFEISTDKVDAEIPSPAAGVLMDIAVKEGETVPVNSVVATIGVAGEKAAAPPAAAAMQPSEKADATGTPGAAVAAPASPSTTNPPPVAAAPVVEPEAVEGDRQKSSPLVRRIAKEHHVDIGRITGTGIGGRVTKQDILGFIDKGGSAPSIDSRSVRPASAPLAQDRPPVVARAAGDEVVPMSVMRKKIAEHMVVSKRTSAHVYSIFEVNYSRVDQIRKTKKEEYERSGAKLTFTSF